MRSFVPEICWIVSYPKSGNTWVRVLLANHIAGTVTPVSINELANYGLIGGFSRDLFDALVGIKSSRLSRSVVDRLRPAVYRAMAAADTRLFVKLHDAWGRTDRNEPIVPEEATAGVVYIVRNVLDVAVSASHHWGLTLEATVDRLCDDAFVLAGHPTRLSMALPQRICGWSGHSRSWLDESGLRTLLVRYEDLLSDSPAILRRIITFCGLDDDSNKIARAAANSSFELLQQQERNMGFVEHSSHAAGRFFRRGTMNCWCEVLPRHLVRKLIDAHGDALKRFGYIDTAGHPMGLST
ncbi:MAG: sulfotransferase domain-containing protein [Stellaceae bacterium]